MPTILEKFYETHKKSAELYAGGREVVAGGAAQCACDFGRAHAQYAAQLRG